MVTRISESLVQDDACEFFAALVDAGIGANGVIEVYEGAVPAAVDDVPAGLLLNTYDFSNPAFITPSAGGVISADTITAQGTNVNPGTATFARIYDTDLNALFDFECSEGGTGLSWDDAVFVVGGTSAITDLTLEMPLECP